VDGEILMRAHEIIATVCVLASASCFRGEFLDDANPVLVCAAARV
jgi:hypothetical protein